MIASQILSPGRVVFVEAPVPQLKPGHALVRPLLISLCGSDVRLVYFAPESEYPMPIGTTGHEMVGIVEAVDAPESDIRPGDIALTLAPYHLAMCEYYLAPAENVLVLPAGKPIEHFLMAQQLGTVIYACKRLPNMIYQNVVVIGQGSAGLFFDTMLRGMGARRVIGLDVKEARVEAGKRFGAATTINTAAQEAYPAVEEITNGEMADLVVEAAGETESINLAARLVQEKGQLLYFGIPRDLDFKFDYWAFFRKYCNTITSGDSMFEPGRTSFHQAIEMIDKEEVDVSTLITHRFPFERVTEAYDLAMTREDQAIKILVEMPGYGQLRRG